ncbi:MAG: fimbrillin family protein [Rikenellaceae bacterium]
MKRNFFVASAIVLAALPSCSKESTLDPSIESVMNSQTEITFSSYASTATTTKGSAVNSNSDFQGVVTTHGSFAVAALVGDAEFSNYKYDTSYNITSYDADPVEGTAVSYFDLTEVSYSTDDNTWVNSSKMYWPNASKLLFFAAYSPSDAAISNYSFSEKTDDSHNENCTYSFDYTVTDVIDDQIDLMYAMTEVPYLAPTDQSKDSSTDSYISTGVTNTNEDDAVNLHFKHALTQIAFTATKSDDLEVYVKSITVCNLYNSGTFTATALTDDNDVTDSNDTVGDTGDDDDKVNADNFGAWTTTFEDDGWDSSNAANTSGTSYYAIAGNGGNKYISNYKATLADFNGSTSPSGANAIQISGTTSLTSSEDVLMLMPQTASEWEPTSSTALNYIGYGSSLSDLTVEVGATKDADNNYIAGTGTDASSTGSKSLSYLAIECEIYHASAADANGDISSGAEIHSGYVFVPFSSAGIDYSQASVDDAVTNATDWLPGYKITYCLNFDGAGYIVEVDKDADGNVIATTIPEPGCVPDTQTYTIREISYTTSVDVYVGM